MCYNYANLHSAHIMPKNSDIGIIGSVHGPAKIQVGKKEGK